MWFDVADTLWQSARTIEVAVGRARPRFHEANSELWGRVGSRLLEKDESASLSKSEKQLQRKSKRLHTSTQMFRVSTMLRAMSIEAELKAAFYTKQLEKHGHVSRFVSEGNHNLRVLAEKVGIRLSDAEVGVLANLEDMLQLGRYPVKWSGKPDARTYRVNLLSTPGDDSRLRTKLKRVGRASYARYKVTHQIEVKECDVEASARAP